MEEIDHDGAQGPIKMSKIGKKMSLPIPLVVRIIILFD
jgi:hypothetical protein